MISSNLSLMMCSSSQRISLCTGTTYCGKICAECGESRQEGWEENEFFAASIAPDGVCCALFVGAIPCSAEPATVVAELEARLCGGALVEAVSVVVDGEPEPYHICLRASSNKQSYRTQYRIRPDGVERRRRLRAGMSREMRKPPFLEPVELRRQNCIIARS